MTEVVIASAVRTPIGKFQGTLKNTPAVKLGTHVAKEAIARAGVQPDAVDEVIMGMVLPAGLGQNPARQVSIHSGVPYSAGALTVNKVCGSGMKSMMIAASSIRAGDYDVALVGGMESMDQAPYLLPKARFGYRLNNGMFVDSMVNDGLWDIYNDFHMGNTGEIVAEKFGIPRREIDEFAARSHTRAAKAQADGLFKSEILPFEIPQRKGDPIVLDHDEGVRPNSTPESLGKLTPVFKKDGVVTAGNASQISDGASATVIMSREKADELGVKPLAKIVAYNFSGMEPEHVMSAPIPGVKKMLETTGLTISDFDLIEHNEAFASASVAVSKEFDIPQDRFNIHGGAVAMGHPIGCSGNRIMVTLVHALRNHGKKRGMGTICLGGGNATTMVIEAE